MSLLSEILSREPAGLLYHYTSQAGLLGIFANKSIWATKIQYLNDASEFSYAFGLAEKSFRRSARGKRDLQKVLRHTRMVLRMHATVNVFTASFSEEGDLLSQWRAYCPASGGYSIGFDHRDLLPSIQTQQFFLAPCIYDVRDQMQLIEEWQDRLPSEESKQSEIYGLTGDFLKIASIIKHPAFSEEREWRIISGMRLYGDEKVAFREGRSMIIPYFQLPLVEMNQTLPVSRIYIGPTPHREAAEASITGLLIKNGNPADLVHVSETPYRTW